MWSVQYGTAQIFSIQLFPSQACSMQFLTLYAVSLLAQCLAASGQKTASFHLIQKAKAMLGTAGPDQRKENRHNKYLSW